MKKVLFFVLTVGFLFFFPFNALAEEVHIYLFYGNTCPICETEREYLETLKKKYSDIQIFEYETFDNDENDEKMQTIKKMYHISSRGVPLTIVGDTAILGFNDANQARIESAVRKYQDTDYYDRVGVYLGLFEDEEIVTSEEVPKSEELPTSKEESKEKERTVYWWTIPIVMVVVIFLISFCLYRERKLHQ